MAPVLALGERRQRSLNAHVAAEIRAQMARLGVTNRQVGRVIGQADSAISRRLSGKQPMTLEEVAALAEYLGLDVGRLVSDYSPPETPNPDPLLGGSQPALPHLDSNQEPAGNRSLELAGSLAQVIPLQSRPVGPIPWVPDVDRVASGL